MVVDNDIFSIFLVVSLLSLFAVMFVKISRKLRKGGGSMSIVILGATDEFYNKDKKNAVEVIVEQNAGKKMEEQSSSGQGRETDG